MDAILQFLIDWGYWGLFLGSFIAGSVLPFSSEAVLAACVGPLGLDPVISIAAATAGNVSGGMTCYWMGLGMMRANIWIVILAMTIGKVLRYALLVWGVLEASALMK